MTDSLKTIMFTLSIKRLAHNEKTDEHILLQTDEINLLIQIPKSLLDFLNDFMTTGTYFLYEIDKFTYFIDHLLKKMQNEGI
jgi:hypothetical protein